MVENLPNRGADAMARTEVGESAWHRVPGVVGHECLRPGAGPDRSCLGRPTAPTHPTEPDARLDDCGWTGPADPIRPTLVWLAGSTGTEPTRPSLGPTDPADRRPARPQGWRAALSGRPQAVKCRWASQAVGQRVDPSGRSEPELESQDWSQAGGSPWRQLGPERAGARAGPAASLSTCEGPAGRWPAPGPRGAASPGLPVGPDTERF